jgi:iron complex outermembrane receptor protein
VLTQAQNISVVKGKISDIETAAPLPMVNIIYGSNRFTVSDRQGNYQFDVDTGNIEIIYKFMGYKTHIEKRYLKKNDTLIINVQLEAKNEQLSEIVVSANRRKQRIADLSVSMSLIKPEYILQNNIINADDLLNQVSGVEIMDGQASIRGGSGYSYGAGSRVLALIDGIPVLSADAGNIKWQFLPLENIASVEVSKGAASVLYGSSALNGIINFRTASPKMKAENNFSVQTGIFDRPQQKNWIWWKNPRSFQNFSISHLKKYGNTDVSLSAAFKNYNSYRKLNDERLIRFNTRIKHYHKNNPSLNYGIAINSGYTYKTDFVLWENADSGALKQNPETASTMKGIFVTFEPFISVQKNNFKHDLRTQIQYTGNNFTEKTQNNSNALSYYGEYQFVWNIKKIIDLISGFSGTYSQISSKFYNNHTAENAAAFSQIEFTAVKKLKLIGGVRLEYNSYDGVSDKLVPVFRTGVNFKATPFTFLRASFGQGYRYPSIAEKYASTTLGTIKIFPNLEIKPETGWTSELGIKQMFRLASLKGQIDLSFFYSENKDMIEYVFGIFPDSETGQMDFGFRASNIENSSVYGVEPQISIIQKSVNSSIVINLGYTYIYPVELNTLNAKQYLKYRNKHSLKATTSFSYKKFRLGLNIFYKSKILNIDNVFLNPATREQILPGFYDYWLENNKGYLVLDGNLAYLINKKFELYFSVRNVTNAEYMGRPGDIRPQRNFSIQLNGKF